MRRYEASRRPHPLSDSDRVLDGITRERTALEDLRGRADLLVDTSNLNVHQLRDRLRELFGGGGPRGRLQANVVSFGYKHGLPLDVDLVFDCRFLPNPHWVEELRPLTGRDDTVREFVLGQPETEAFLTELERLFHLLVPALRAGGQVVPVHRGRLHRRPPPQRRDRRGAGPSAQRDGHARGGAPSRRRPGLTGPGRGPPKWRGTHSLCCSRGRGGSEGAQGMTVRVGINGFGRIGRSFTRALLERSDADVELVAVNDPFGDNHTMAFLLKHDSVGGNAAQRRARRRAAASRSTATTSSQARGEGPGRDPVGRHRGRRRDRVDRPVHRPGAAAGHLEGGAKRVVISAPSGDADAMICMGVNDDVFDPASHTRDLQRLVHDQLPRSAGEGPRRQPSASSRASSRRSTPTPGPAAPGPGDGVSQGKPDLRRMRAAALSIIPASTGAARAIGHGDAAS